MFSFSQQTKLRGIFLLGLLWLGLGAWAVAWPPTWFSLPVFLLLAYAAVRFFFELTLNRARVPTLATSFIARRKVVEILQREADKSGKTPYRVVDFGSGRGELARLIAKRIPHAEVCGVELAAIPFLQASWIQRLWGPSNLSYCRADFWNFDCSETDAVFLYLSPRVLEPMGAKLARELKAGSVVLTFIYPIPGAWEPEEVFEFRSPFAERIFVYKKN